MLKKIFLFLFLSFVIDFNILNANDIKSVNIFDPLKQTPSRLLDTSISKPTSFSTSNDLTRKVGSFDVANGELLYFVGSITDAFGIPIEGANIRIWQTNSYGKYHSLLEDGSKYIDDNFVMSGTAKTDNLGRYGFKTIFPGFEKGRAPYININIVHPKFGEIETEVFFENHPSNENDLFFSAYPEEDKKLITARVKNISKNPKDGKVATFDIVMDGIHSYKEY